MDLFNTGPAILGA